MMVGGAFTPDRLIALTGRLVDAADFAAVAEVAFDVMTSAEPAAGAVIVWRTAEPETAVRRCDPAVTETDLIGLARTGPSVEVRQLAMDAGPHGTAEFTVVLGAPVADTGPVDDALRTAAAVCVPVLHRLAVDELHRAEQANTAFLAEATAQMEKSLDVPDTLQRVARLTAPTLADGCLIYLLGEPDGARLVAAAHIDARIDRRVRDDLVHDDKLSDAVASTFADHARDDPPAAAESRIREALPDWITARAVRVTPLRPRGRLIGTLVLIERPSGRPSRLPSAEFLADLARRAAIAIDNALLYARRDAAARALQRRLLPPSLPVLPRMELAARYVAGDPSLDVGGDFYDAVALPDGGVALVIGDVSGRGADAAGRTAQARHTLRALLESGAGAAQSLHRLNRAMLDDDEPSAFCTALVVEARVTGDAAVLTVVNAGHPPPVVIPERGDARELAVHGPLLGVLDDAVFTGEQVAVGAHDTVLLYTDGLTEARRDGRLFGSEGVLAALAGTVVTTAAGLVAHVDEAVTRYRSGGSDDDMALLALRLRGGELCRVALPAGPIAASHARREVRTVLAARLPGLRPDLLDDVILSTSELVAAAVLSGRDRIELVASRGPGVIRVELVGPVDPSPPHHQSGAARHAVRLAAQVARRSSISHGDPVFAWAEVELDDD